jgi:hypothetical protein
MRQEFDNELQAARGEVAKAQEALAGSEERIRAAEQVCGVVWTVRDLKHG